MLKSIPCKNCGGNRWETCRSFDSYIENAHEMIEDDKELVLDCYL